MFSHFVMVILDQPCLGQTLQEITETAPVAKLLKIEACIRLLSPHKLQT